jgi:hypothetical protein
MPDFPVVYLVHFTPRLAHAGHYLGQADDLADRWGKHEGGNGSRLVTRAIEAGCRVELVRWWPGDRTFESTFKRHGGASPRSRKGRHGARRSLATYCPRCCAAAARHRPDPIGWIEPITDITDITVTS